VTIDSQVLSSFEQAVMDKLLAGDHPILVVLRRQAEVASLEKREETGVGFFCYFAVPSEFPRVAEPEDFRISDVEAEMEGLGEGAGFTLLIEEGRLVMLEGFSYTEPWPKSVGAYELRYREMPRKLEFISQ